MRGAMAPALALLLLAVGTASAHKHMMWTAPSPSTCYPSSLGYQCYLQVCEGIGLHWSLGGPGPNGTKPCTYMLPGSVGNNTKMLASTGANNSFARVIHFAVQTTGITGYAALSFPLNAGEMVPADAVVGWYDYNSGGASAIPYAIKGFTEDANQPDPQVALDYVDATIGSGQNLTVCFSRLVEDRGTAAGVALSLSGTDMNFAAGPHAYLTHHVIACSTKVSFLASLATLDAGASVPVGGNTGEASVEADATEGASMVHGVLMIIVWGFLVPMGVMASRFRDVPLPADRPGAACHRICGGWFNRHLWFQSSAVVLFFISMWIIVRAHGLEFSHWQGLTKAHGGVGVVVVILLTLHVILALARPKHGGVFRVQWEWIHRVTAVAMILMSSFNLMSGPSVYGHMMGADMGNSDAAKTSRGLWGAGMGLMLVMGLIMVWQEIRLRQRRRAQGYEGHSEYHAAGLAEMTSGGLQHMGDGSPTGGYGERHSLMGPFARGGTGSQYPHYSNAGQNGAKGPTKTPERQALLTTSQGPHRYQPEVVVQGAGGAAPPPAGPYQPPGSGGVPVSTGARY